MIQSRKKPARRRGLKGKERMGGKGPAQSDGGAKTTVDLGKRQTGSSKKKGGKYAVLRIRVT